MKRFKKSGAVAASVRRLLALGGSQLRHGDRLRKALRKYEEALERGNARRTAEAASEIAEIACDEYVKKTK